MSKDIMKNNILLCAIILTCSSPLIQAAALLSQGEKEVEGELSNNDTSAAAPLPSEEELRDKRFAELINMLTAPLIQSIEEFAQPIALMDTHVDRIRSQVMCDNIQAICLSADKRYLATSSDKNVVRLWDILGCRVLYECGICHSLQNSAYDCILASVAEQKLGIPFDSAIHATNNGREKRGMGAKILLRDAKTSTVLRTFQMPKKQYQCVEACGDSTVLTYGVDRVVHLWKPRAIPLVKYAWHLSEQLSQRKKN